MINKKQKKTEVKSLDSLAHLNYMNSKSFKINNPINQLRTVCSSSFFGEPMYYQDEKSQVNRDWVNKININNKHQNYLNEILSPVLSKPEYHNYSPTKLIETVIDEALDFNPEQTLIEAVRLRQEDNIRTTPQVIMVRAANHPKVRGTNLISKYGLNILSRTDEATVQLSYQIQVFGKPIPNSLKRVWKKFLETKSKFQLAKYKMEKRAFKTRDVVNLVHAKSESIDLLMKNKLALEPDNTWESYISKNGSSKESWTKAIELMGHMALLRNINNLIKNDVEECHYLQKLKDTAIDSKQMPFRYFSAYKKVSETASGNVLDAIEYCMELSMEELPKFKGKVMSLCDNSGSAQGTTTSKMGTMKHSSIANLMAIITGRCADDGYIGLFGDKLKVLPVRKQNSILDQMENAEKESKNIGLGTENGIWLFFKNAIEKKEHFDHIFVYSDMQAGHGGLFGLDKNEYKEYIYGGNNSRSDRIDVPSLIKDYRKTVNKDVIVYLVQTSGYRDTLLPEFYDKTYIMGGWSDGLIKFAHKMSQK